MEEFDDDFDYLLEREEEDLFHLLGQALKPTFITEDDFDDWDS